MRIRIFIAHDIAKYVLPIFDKKYPDDERPRLALIALKLYAGRPSTENYERLSTAARAAYCDCPRYAKNDAANAANAAAYAAYSAYPTNDAYVADTFYAACNANAEAPSYEREKQTKKQAEILRKWLSLEEK